MRLLHLSNSLSKTDINVLSTGQVISSLFNLSPHIVATTSKTYVFETIAITLLLLL